jgi:small-conductance mechanosensitive channel
MNEWLMSHTFLTLPIYQWASVAVLSLLYFFLILGSWNYLIAKLSDLSLKTPSKFDDLLIEVLRVTHKATFVFLAILLGMRFFDLSEKWFNRLDHATFIVIGIQVTIWLTKGIDLWGNGKLINRDGDVPNPVIIGMLSWIFRAVVWSVLLLTLLANVGVNITAFVASLGIGGVAVALAVQNILSDLFASLSIGLDKPFVIGDFIVFGSVAGTVERIGLKSTHIRSVNGEQIVCSNTELLKNTIQNYKRMSKRRVLFTFGVRYDTDPDCLAQIPELIKSYIEKIDIATFDRAHFKSFGDQNLEFEVVYMLDTNDFNTYMDIQQSLNLFILRELKKLEVDFMPNVNFISLNDDQKVN